VRGTKGSFMKFGTDAQEAHAIAGIPATDPGFGVEDATLHGLLFTTHKFDSSCQSQEPLTKKYVGKYPTITGRYLGFYENLVDALEGGQNCRSSLSSLATASASSNWPGNRINKAPPSNGREENGWNEEYCQSHISTCCYPKAAASYLHVQKFTCILAYHF